MPRKRLARRRLLRHAAGLGAGACLAPLFVPAGILSAFGRPGANDRLKIGMIGCGFRGRNLLADMPAEARVTAICDFDRSRMESVLHPQGADRAAALSETSGQGDGRQCATFQDYRQMFDRTKLDAVVIASPDHHHVLAAMLACQAGLDVYVEKALSRTIAEGRALVEAVRRTGRVCQVGSQQRSMEMNRFACRLVWEGGLGQVTLVQVENFPGPLPDETLPEEPVPQTLIWDLFCGPAPLRPYHWKLWMKDVRRIDGRLWRGWDMWRDYSGHLMTNWGAHAVDQVQWALGMDSSGPVEMWPLGSVGGGSDGEVEARLRPVAMRYSNGVELRFDARRSSTGGIFQGAKGRMTIGRNSFRAEPRDLVAQAPDRSVAEIWRGAGIVAKPHLQNWIDCIKRRITPNAPVETGHRSATICHLAAICRELGRRLRWDPQRETFPGDDQANALISRPRRKGFELPQVV